MIIDTKTSTVHTNIATKEMAFKIDDAAPEIIVKMVADMYPDPRRTLLTEYVQNALDSHDEAGCSDRPLLIKLPDAFDPEYSVRDYGTGMTEEQVESIFRYVLRSTKRDNEDARGGFGVGKMVFGAYTGIMYLELYSGEEKVDYVARLDNSAASILRIGSTPSTEERGVKVRIPVLEDDFAYFKDVSKKLYVSLPTRPVFEGMPDFWDGVDETIKDATLWTSKDGRSRVLSNTPEVKELCINNLSSHTIFLGGIAFPLNCDLLYENFKFVESAAGQQKEQLCNLTRAKSYSWHLHFGPSELDIVPSRDNLKYNKKTVTAIYGRLSLILEEIQKSIAAETVVAPTLQEVLRNYRLYQDILGTPVHVMARKAKWRGIPVYSPVYDLFFGSCKGRSNHSTLGISRRRISQYDIEEWDPLTSPYAGQVTRGIVHDLVPDPFRTSTDISKTLRGLFENNKGELNMESLQESLMYMVVEKDRDFRGTLKQLYSGVEEWVPEVWAKFLYELCCKVVHVREPVRLRGSNEYRFRSCSGLMSPALVVRAILHRKLEVLLVPEDKAKKWPLRSCLLPAVGAEMGKSNKSVLVVHLNCSVEEFVGFLRSSPFGGAMADWKPLDTSTLLVAARKKSRTKAPPTSYASRDLLELVPGAVPRSGCTPDSWSPISEDDLENMEKEEDRLVVYAPVYKGAIAASRHDHPNLCETTLASQFMNTHTSEMITWLKEKFKVSKVTIVGVKATKDSRYKLSEEQQKRSLCPLIIAEFKKILRSVQAQAWAKGRTDSKNHQPINQEYCKLILTGWCWEALRLWGLGLAKNLNTWKGPMGDAGREVLQHWDAACTAGVADVVSTLSVPSITAETFKKGVRGTLRLTTFQQLLVSRAWFMRGSLDPYPDDNGRFAPQSPLNYEILQSTIGLIETTDNKLDKDLHTLARHEGEGVSRRAVDAMGLGCLTLDTRWCRIPFGSDLPLLRMLDHVTPDATKKLAPIPEVINEGAKRAVLDIKDGNWVGPVTDPLVYALTNMAKEGKLTKDEGGILGCAAAIRDLRKEERLLQIQRLMIGLQTAIKTKIRRELVLDEVLNEISSKTVGRYSTFAGVGMSDHLERLYTIWSLGYKGPSWHADLRVTPDPDIHASHWKKWIVLQSYWELSKLKLNPKSREKQEEVWRKVGFVLTTPQHTTY